MLIGLTYDLRADYATLGFPPEALAEFDSEETIAALDRTLAQLGHRVERLGHLRALVPRLAAGERWDLVFNLCEGLAGRSREAQVPALLEAYGLRYTFGDPLTLALTLDKAMAKRVVRDAGLATPDFFTVETPAEGAAAARRGVLAYPLFAKPNAEGTGKGITTRSVLSGPGDLERVTADLLARYRQPVLVESYLSGREFTVGVLGTGARARALGVMEVTLLDNAEPGVYSFTNKELCEDRVRYALVADPDLTRDASELAVGAYRALGCRDAGRVDLRADSDGTLHFLEVNPLAGLHPTHSDLPILAALAGWTYPKLIAAIVSSALEREPLPALPLSRAVLSGAVLSGPSET
jgi:D-alanine-D-alanine ligase